ncbi:hypothetical protein PybrP1_012843 [[Pythium] brassicae (nom. inval.)]|nr:hypothetical protein PybrP1_012843 [[Pythium] brassicae (nom. inval.)]
MIVSGRSAGRSRSRVFPLSVDTGGPWSAADSSANGGSPTAAISGGFARGGGGRAPPPPKSPLHGARSAAGHMDESVAQAPQRGVDRMLLLRQQMNVTSSAGYQSASAARSQPLPPVAQPAPPVHELSAAQNHKVRKAAEATRRREAALMALEDYTGTPEGLARLARQEERAHMQEEEARMARIRQAEKAHARAQQLQAQREEEARVHDAFLAKARAERDAKARAAQANDAARRLAMEEKMKALKAAADAKARDEYAARQRQLAAEALAEREQRAGELERAQLAVEDAFAAALRQDARAARERQQQIAAEEATWKRFEAAEAQRQLEATTARRAAQAAQYAQDKQRRMEIHRLQKERARLVAEKRHQTLAAPPPQGAGAASSATDDRSADATVVDAEAETKRQYREISLDDGASEPQQEPSTSASAAEELERDADAAVAARATGEEHEGDCAMSSALGPDDALAAAAPTPASSDEQEDDGRHDAGHEPLGADTELSDAQLHDVDGTPVEAAVGDALPSDHDQELSSANDDDLPVDGAEELLSCDGERPTSLERPATPRAPLLLSAHDARAQALHPFAQVLHVKDGSPAMEATLRAGDLLLAFGGLTGATPNCLLLIAERIKSAVGRGIALTVLRPVDADASGGERFVQEALELCPRKWKGKGLLGCQLNPFKWADEEEEEAEEAEAASPTLLVFYDVAPDSVADRIGIAAGDLLTRCGALDAVDDLGAVLGCFDAARAAHADVALELQRWLPDAQRYEPRAVAVPALAADEHLGCSLTTFAAFYGAASTPAACTECYYTGLATAVHAAALHGHVACLDALLAAAADDDDGDGTRGALDWRDDDGRSPLFYACYAQQFACAELLLARGAAFDPQSGGDAYGDSPLHAAALSGSLALLALLLERAVVAVDTANAAQLTCAHVAPTADVLRLLGERFGADLLAADADGRLPLAHACLRGDLASVEYLCAKHPDFADYADAGGNTPLHLAAWRGRPDVLRELVRHVPAIALHLPNRDGARPLDVARASGCDAAAQFLEQCMANEPARG